MQDLINSIVRFSAAVTMFSLQQVQNTFELAVDSEGAIKKFRESVDAVTNAINSQLDESKRPAVNSMSNLGTDMVGRTWDGMNVSAFDPREVIQTTGDIVRRTTDSLSGWMKKAGSEKASAGEPQPAAEALAGKK
jgi:hypothetical protein